MSRIYISAAHKSSGKTTVSIGLCAAFADRDLKVQPFKKGPDYIDPMWLSRAAKSPCSNLDFYTMSQDEILATYGRQSETRDIAIIEGNKGLYDGLDLDGSNSNAALAKLLKCPIILVLDARGVTRGIAPLILGYQAFDADINIAGVILNNVGGSRHESKLRAVIEHYTDIKTIGAVNFDAGVTIQERHLGLIPEREYTTANVAIKDIADKISSQINIDAVKSLADNAPPLRFSATPPNICKPPDVKIGIVRDAAFGFYYEDDLSAFKHAGAELIFINAIKDQSLPLVDGLFIGGGFPETHARALSENHQLRADIRRFVDANLPVYAECGGLMYLARSLAWRGKTHEMVGAIPADVIMREKPIGRGYVRLRQTGRSSWSITGTKCIDNEYPAHEFHYSELINISSNIKYAYNVCRGRGIDGKHDGLLVANVLASYSHLRNTQTTPWVECFVNYVRQQKNTRTQNTQYALSV